MSASSFTIANLQVREALLCLDDYQQKLRELTVFEWKDIRQRYPNLIEEHMMSPGQREEFRQSLFWGSSSVSMEDDSRAIGWLAALAESLSKAINALESTPELEAAFEILYVVDCLQRMPDQDQRQAAEWNERVTAVLLRPEFRLTRELVDERLRGLMGEEPRRKPYYGGQTN